VVFGRRAGESAAAFSAGRDLQLRARRVVRAANEELSSFVRHGRQFARPLQRALRDAMWETCGVVRDQAGLRRGLERVAELRELAGEVSRLPEPHRAAVVLRCVQGLSYAQAASLLGQPEGTVKSNVHRGLATLRRRLDLSEVS
jgi:DNA-directed RNA polymerase specialized sigma24 family protein